MRRIVVSLIALVAVYAAIPACSRDGTASAASAVTPNGLYRDAALTSPADSIATKVALSLRNRHGKPNGHTLPHRLLRDHSLYVVGKCRGCKNQNPDSKRSDIFLHRPFLIQVFTSLVHFGHMSIMILL